MTALTALFRQTLSMAALALPVMAVVLLARWVLQKGGAPKKYAYALWAVAAFRLCCPTSAGTSTPWSIFNLKPLQPITALAGEDACPAAGNWAGAGHGALSEAAGGALSGGAGSVAGALSGQTPSLSARGTALEIAAAVWLLGLLALAVYSAASYLRLRKRLSTAVRRDTNVYQQPGLPTPFVLGYFRPRIYLPLSLTDQERTYVLCHERFHLRRLDPWWKLLGFALCAVYWWNPAVWGCYVLFCRDMEMSCDEHVLSELGTAAKRGYSLSLLGFAGAGRFSPAAPLAFGEGDAGRRVGNVLSWKRETPRIAFLAAALGLVVAATCTTNGRSGSYLQLAQGESGTGAAVTCRLEEPVRSWAIYQDIYQRGALVSSTPVILSGYAGDSFPLPQTVAGQLSCAVSPSDSGDGFDGTLQCRFDSDALYAWSITLPETHYTGCGQLLGGDGKTGKQTLEAGEDAPLLSIQLSTRLDGAISLDGGADYNAATVVFRLATSAQTAESFPAQDGEDPFTARAQALFALKTPYVGDVSADGKLLTALGVGELGDYTVELFTSAEPYILQVNFTEEPSDIDPTSPAIDDAMQKKAVLALALIDNLSEVRWSYPSREDGQTVHITMYQDRAQPDAWAQALGYDGIKALGQSAEGIRALLGYLKSGSADALLPDAVWFAPKDIRDLTGAELVGPDGTVYPVTAENGLTSLEKQLSMAQPIATGGTGCPFGSAVYLRRADGVTGKILPAGDSCGVFQSNGMYYDFGDSSQGLYAAFGLTAEDLLYGSDGGTITCQLTDRGAPYPASFGALCQFGCTLPAGAAYSLTAVTYVDGQSLGETALTGGSASDLGRAFWLSCSMDMGSWDALRWTLYPEKDEGRAVELSVPLIGHAASYASRDFSWFGQSAADTAQPISSPTPLMAVCVSQAGSEPVIVPCETLTDDGALEQFASDNAVAAAVYLTLLPGGAG